MWTETVATDRCRNVGMHELTMPALAAARLDEAGGLQSANQFTSGYRSITYR
jgi:hypothetical protein